MRDFLIITVREPVFLLAGIILFVLFFTYIFYRYAIDLDAGKRKLRIRWYAFWSEIFVISGLVGVFYFAGQFYINNNINFYANNMRDKKIDLLNSWNKFSSKYCYNYDVNLIIDSSIIAIDETCKINDGFAGTANPPVDEKTLAAYKKIISYENFEVNEILKDIKQFSEEYSVMSRKHHNEKNFLNHKVIIDYSLVFIIVSIFSLIGVSMKCARVLVELIDECKGYKQYLARKSSSDKYSYVEIIEEMENRR